MLIDPTAEDPFDHLLLTLALGEYHPLTPEGVTTIAVCGLNRPLPTRGRQARRVVDLSLQGWEDGRRRSDAMASVVLTIREQPFADVCQSMLRQATAPGADILSADAPSILELLRTPELNHVLPEQRARSAAQVYTSIGSLGAQSPLRPLHPGSDPSTPGRLSAHGSRRPASPRPRYSELAPPEIVGTTRA
ncbi:hypothetical protein [Embleya scabrispora]|uniref:hypothetical protein n=1 Tax=Embleya scabrispora TaxID=159449 RepID=UPI001319B9F1|nr:hypothetical protein [Embleya scabrispora]MYS83486.1 hypothetical protein [Streptomyces sp. SID5474]